MGNKSNNYIKKKINNDNKSDKDSFRNDERA